MIIIVSHRSDKILWLPSKIWKGQNLEGEHNWCQVNPDKKNHPNLTIKHKVLILYKETQNYVYYWKCVKPNCKSFPNCEYISLTGRPFRQRLAEHKQYIRSKTLDKPSGWHFNQQGHELSHLAGLVHGQCQNNRLDISNHTHSSDFGWKIV